MLVLKNSLIPSKVNSWCRAKNEIVPEIEVPLVDLSSTAESLKKYVINYLNITTIQYINMKICCYVGTNCCSGRNGGVAQSWF